MYENTVVSCGRLADGTPIAAQNVGYYVWKYSAEAPFGDNGGYGNEAAWAVPGGRNDWWVPDAASWEGNVRLAEASCEMERAVYAEWLQDASTTVGAIGYQ